jgi:8-oxo-dGTP diphosphatase
LAQELWFEGAKLVLFLGRDLMVLRRDHTPGIPWPGYLDLPGGGRDAGESAEACVLRETHEELGLWLAPEELQWRRFYAAPRPVWFFAAWLPPERGRGVRFGGEGIGWCLMAPEAFVAHAEAVPHFTDRVRTVLEERPEGSQPVSGGVDGHARP